MTFILGFHQVIALHEFGLGAFGFFVFGDYPQALGHFLIGLDEAAHVSPETVLVHLVVGLGVPKAARIGADLIGQHNAHHVILIEPAELDFEIDELDADSEEEAR